MILNLGSLSFNADINGGGGTPAWGTEMGQGDGYRFNFEDSGKFITGLLYNSIPNTNEVTCPLGKGGQQAADYEFVIASLFKKIFVNGESVPNAQFILLVVKKLVGANHVGRRTLKYNPKMTYKGSTINEDCYRKIEKVLGIKEGAAWFINEINIENQDELHFTAYVLSEHSCGYVDSNVRKQAYLEKIKGTNPKFKGGGIKLPDDFKNQVIYYGAPGTGKSFKARKDTFDKPHIRTIFHPDSDYSSFVGCYKPVMENGRIVYKYRAQSFINAYINAWTTNEAYYLVIEEINRGNCAQIFGDIFQLLDRTEGDSDYEVHPDTDLQNYLKETFNSNIITNRMSSNGVLVPIEILNGEVMRLPKNLSIIATMNTSDQSLFPMDSAFKRRWDWKYFAIKDEGMGYKIKVGEDGPEYDWWKTIEALNEKILGATKSSDKQIGYWFAKLPEGDTIIDAERFVSKVVFYLWNDVFKDFSFGDNNPFTKETTFEAFFDAKGNVVNDVVKAFLDRNCPTE